jgi:aconitate hydratase
VSAQFAACRRTARLGGQDTTIFSLPALAEMGFPGVHTLPICLRIVIESLLRHAGDEGVPEAAVAELAAWQPHGVRTTEIPFVIGRVILQDVAGIPLLGDLAAMRGALARAGRSGTVVRPAVPVDMVIDHTLSVDFHAAPDAMSRNMQREFDRNTERFRFVKWASQAFGGIRVIPPGIGILHQVNLEYLAQGLIREGGMVYPDTLVGTDSHSCMIAGLGVVGWGVGGIEAEAAMLGHPIGVLTPDVVAVELTGTLPTGATATDLVLELTHRLRRVGVVGKFLEFVGPGVHNLTVPDRATVANMAPEYGATIGFFPFDAMTARYLRETGREPALVAMAEDYFAVQGCRAPDRAAALSYSDVLRLDLAEIMPCVAGPRRPQDTIPLGDLGRRFEALLTEAPDAGGYGKAAPTQREGDRCGEGRCGDGDIAIAAITSCTNTANPGAMLAAGLVAKRAVQRGLRPPPWVKTSFAPGSRVVSRYLERTGLQSDLDALGFHVVGYACTTCIGNSGPLTPTLERDIAERNVIACAVLSGNRNFESRIHPALRAAFLASPPNVVAYALAGTVRIDLETEPLGRDPDGRPVMLSELWPAPDELAAAMHAAADAEAYRESYADPGGSNVLWNTLPCMTGELFAWDEASTSLREPPFLDQEFRVSSLRPVTNGRILALLGDNITTDHISPIGHIRASTAAAQYLRAHHVVDGAFGSYGERRMNHHVMVRGTFDNARLRNRMAAGREGAVTMHHPSGEVMSLYEAACRYQATGVPMFIVAGHEYGTGSARDWAAKGTRLLGVRAVIANSFERIHRSNLVGMGVLPCEFPAGVTAESLLLDGSEELSMPDIGAAVRPRQAVILLIRRADGSTTETQVTLRVDTQSELAYLGDGGIMPSLLRRLAGRVGPAVCANPICSRR